jgi:hypothetical protein
MSDKDRKKKDGHDKNKELQAMHTAVAERHEEQQQQDEGPNKGSSDEQDHIEYKRGSGGDDSQRGAR